MKARGESLAKRRRWVSGAVESEGNGIGTASLREENEAEEVDGVEVEGDVDDEGMDDELEKMMWESDGVGYKSKPNSLAMVASLYVFVMISFVGRKTRLAFFNFVVLLVLVLALLV